MEQQEGGGETGSNTWSDLMGSNLEIRLGLIGMFVIIGLVAVVLWVIVANSPFEMKVDADRQFSLLADRFDYQNKSQDQINAQITATLDRIATSQAALTSQMSDFQDDEIQMQQWLMDNNKSFGTMPFQPRRGLQRPH